jgi:hypothetical protein
MSEPRLKVKPRPGQWDTVGSGAADRAGRGGTHRAAQRSDPGEAAPATEDSSGTGGAYGSGPGEAIT